MIGSVFHSKRLGKLHLATTASLFLLALCDGCSTPSRSGRPWTIQCMELRGPESAARIEQVAETLRRTPGVRGEEVFVLHEDDAARLYYGKYYRRNDPKTRKWALPKQIHDDLGLVREMGDESGRRYFFQAFPVPLPLPDVGNPAWALANVQRRYSLQVAAFEATDDFYEYKQVAAEFCEFLRGKGYEAYYHHGPASSVVTVGSFGDDAVRLGPDGRTYYSSQVLTLQRDELLRYNLLNGAVYKVKHPDGRSVPVPSRLIEIPREAEPR